MNPASVLEKTTKGVEEIETRKHKLDAKLRTILITINGKLTAAELASRFAQLGDVAPLLDELVALGFARAAALDDPATVRRAIGEAARALTDVLGPQGDAITARLEACKSLAEARAFLDAQRASLDTVLGKSRAGPFWQKIDALLA